MFIILINIKAPSFAKIDKAVVAANITHSASNVYKLNNHKYQEFNRPTDIEANLLDGSLYMLSMYNFYKSLKKLKISYPDKQRLTFPYMVAGLVSGWLLADLISGIGHVMGSHILKIDAPYGLGGFAEALQNHHNLPLQHAGISIWSVNRKTARLMSALNSTYMILGFYYAHKNSMLKSIVLNMTGFLLWHSKTIHHITHGYMNDNLFVRWLLDGGLILNQEEYLAQHQPNNHKGFCVINGWTNCVLDLLTTRLLPRFEKFTERSA